MVKVYPCMPTKFEVSSFTCSKFMEGVQDVEIQHLDLHNALWWYFVIREMEIVKLAYICVPN